MALEDISAIPQDELLRRAALEAGARQAVPQIQIAPPPQQQARSLPGVTVPSPENAAPGPSAAATPLIPSLRQAGSPQLQAHQQELQRLEASPSGVASLTSAKHSLPVRVLGGIARIGDALGSAIVPSLMVNLPGTTLHHQQLVGQARGNVVNDLAQEYAQAQTAAENAQTAETQARIPQIQAETRLYNAQAEAALHPKPEKAENIQQLYADAVSDAFERGVDPNQDPKVMQLADAITSLQRQPAGKEPTRDDKAIAIYAKPQEQWTPEERAYIQGYEKYITKSKTEPGVMRAQVYVNNRVVPIIDPDNPDNLVYQTPKEAAKNKSLAPGSIGFQTKKSVTNAFTRGPEARSLNAFNTAIDHLQQLNQAADALHNGDIRLVNELGQRWAAATGEAAPTNFNAIKGAVAGEVAKTFKGGEATDAEIRQLNDTINRANSPAQLKGAIAQFSALMMSKRHALEQQYKKGMQAQPNFGGTEGAATHRFNPATGKIEVIH